MAVGRGGHAQREVVSVTVFFDPFREMDRMTRELMGRGLPGGQGQEPRWMPMDLYREGDHFVANIDMPGVDPGSIDIDVEGNTLTIRAQRTVRGQDAQWLSQERPSGSFMRQLTLGEGVDMENIHADYEHGVLSMTIPVAAESKPRKIQIQGSRSEPQPIGQSDQSMQEPSSGESEQ
jgi:HSP20 family protein